MCVLSLLLFCKQKTAYGMRISDWSSDMCSSDLLVPGDPAIAILGDQATEESLQALRQQLGLDRPLHEQYVVFLGQVLSGDLGRSMSSGRTGLEEVWQVLPYTLELTASALLIGALFGLPLGTWEIGRAHG